MRVGENERAKAILCCLVAGSYLKLRNEDNCRIFQAHNSSRERGLISDSADCVAEQHGYITWTTQIHNKSSWHIQLTMKYSFSAFWPSVIRSYPFSTDSMVRTHHHFTFIFFEKGLMAYISRASLLLCANRFCIRFHFIPSSYRSCPASTEEKEEEGSDMETCRSLRLREIINFTFVSREYEIESYRAMSCASPKDDINWLLFIYTQVGDNSEVKTKFRISSNLVTRLFLSSREVLALLSNFVFSNFDRRQPSERLDLRIVQIGDHDVASCKISWELSEFNFIAISLCLHKIFWWWEGGFFERRKEKEQFTESWLKTWSNKYKLNA